MRQIQGAADNRNYQGAIWQDHRKVIQGCTISEVPGIEELVKLEDSRKNGMAMLMDTDQFLNLVVRW